MQLLQGKDRPYVVPVIRLKEFVDREHTLLEILNAQQADLPPPSDEYYIRSEADSTPSESDEKLF